VRTSYVQVRTTSKCALDTSNGNMVCIFGVSTPVAARNWCADTKNGKCMIFSVHELHGGPPPGMLHDWVWHAHYILPLNIWQHVWCLIIDRSMCMHRRPHPSRLECMPCMHVHVEAIDDHTMCQPFELGQYITTSMGECKHGPSFVTVSFPFYGSPWGDP
jgi:hypothetical protein